MLAGIQILYHEKPQPFDLFLKYLFEHNCFKLEKHLSIMEIRSSICFSTDILDAFDFRNF